MSRRLLTSRDLLAVQMVDDPQLSPSGDRVAWVHTWIDAAADGYRSSICITDSVAGATRRVTAGRGQESVPRWSPDGRWLAYLSTDPAGGAVMDEQGAGWTERAPQLYILPMDSDKGHGRVLTQVAHGVQSPVWSPDGRRIAVGVQIDPAVGLELDTHPATDAISSAGALYAQYNADVLVVRRRKWKMDSQGYLGERVRALAVVELAAVADEETAPASVSIRLVAAGPGDLAAPVWSPDSRTLAAVGNLEADADITRRQVVYLFDLSGELPAAPQPLLSLADIRHPGLAWSPDGRMLAVAGHDNALIGHYGNQQLWLIDVAAGAARPVTGHLDLTLGYAAYTDVGRYGGESGVRWLPDSRHVLALVSTEGSVRLCRIDTENGNVTPLTVEDISVAAFTLDQSGRQAAALVRTPLNPGDVALFDLAAALPQAGRQLTQVNAALLAEVELSATQRFFFDSGGVTVDGWLIPPAQPATTTKHPAILYCGGGPGGMRTGDFFFDYQLLAAAGYALVYCNSHGCQGYGEAFCTAILGRWGEADYQDNLAAVEAACAQFPFIDPERWGIAGGSYGGYLVNWAIGHSDRFRAAVADRSVVNRLSSYGTSDIGHLREFEYGDSPPWENVDAYVRQSPLATLGSARTPTLVVHSVQDHRCPVEQGEQLYMALKRLGVPTELVRFPNESHELSRSGRPWHRVFRLDCYLDWFARWL
jgi:dipeptidyl aminopeptidase/acylaminoacyl peptidase